MREDDPGNRAVVAAAIRRGTCRRRSAARYRSRRRSPRHHRPVQRRHSRRPCSRARPAHRVRPRPPERPPRPRRQRARHRAPHQGAAASLRECTRSRSIRRRRAHVRRSRHRVLRPRAHPHRPRPRRRQARSRRSRCSPLAPSVRVPHGVASVTPARSRVSVLGSGRAAQPASATARLARRHSRPGRRVAGRREPRCTRSSERAPESARTAPSPAIVRLIRLSGMSWANWRAATSRSSSAEYVVSRAAACRWPARVSASTARSRARHAQASAYSWPHAAVHPATRERRRPAGAEILWSSTWHLAVELDLPQLVGEPPREVLGSAGMNTAPARDHLGARTHPYPRFGPLEAAEGPGPAGPEELVGDHLPALCLARQAERTAGDGSTAVGSDSARSEETVASI